MGRPLAPRHQLNAEEHFYKYRDDAGTWWWVCTCSQACWDHMHYRSWGALHGHQTASGRDMCPVDEHFKPPVHSETVSIEHRDAIHHQRARCGGIDSISQQLIHNHVHGPQHGSEEATVSYGRACSSSDMISPRQCSAGPGHQLLTGFATPAYHVEHPHTHEPPPIPDFSLYAHEDPCEVPLAHGASSRGCCI